MGTVGDGGYAPALERAREDLEGLDLRSRSDLCGGRYLAPDGAVALMYFGSEHTVFPDGRVDSPHGPAPLVSRLILLHYLARSSGIGPSGRSVAFREVPDGTFYFPSFRDRAVRPLLERYGEDPDLLRRRGGALGWRTLEGEDVRIETNALPLVPIQVILWRGDEEFSPEASILFDATVPDHLHTEDIALIAQEAVRVLKGEQRDV